MNSKKILGYGTLSLMSVIAVITTLAFAALSMAGCKDPADTTGGIPTTYAVTVTGGTLADGTGSGNYAQGETVAITANTPPAGQQFKNWTTASAGVTFANANSAGTTFTMPGNAVTVTANFEPVSYSGPTIQEQADAFNVGHNEILAKTVETVTTSDETAVNAAVAAYNALPQDVKDLLTVEKAKLDSLKNKIDELKAAAAFQEQADAFKTAHSTALGKIAANVAITDETAVNAALAAYNALPQDVKNLLTAEKTLLDSLKNKIDELNALNSAGITITVKQIEDETPTFAPITISRSGSNKTSTVTVQNASAYDSIAWEVAGVGAGQTVTGTGASFTLNTANANYNSLGGHALILTVTKGAGANAVQYRRAIPFTIVQ